MSYITTNHIESVVEKLLVEADIDNPPIKVDGIAEFICGLEFGWSNLDKYAKNGEVLAAIVIQDEKIYMNESKEYELLEIPKIEPPEKIVIPSGMIPYSQRNRSKNFSECLVFYEYDINFADIVRKPQDFVDDVLRFPAVVTPDNSLYRDAPLIVQMLNVYRNRAIGHCLQKNGAYIITNVR